MAIPVLTALPGIEEWRQALNKRLKVPLTPKVPWNFKVSNKQGGNYLTWDTVKGADGYIVSISLTGDFSTGVDEHKLPGNQAVSFFDSVPTSGGAAPAARFYTVRATSGTVSNPQSVQGLSTGVVSSTALAPNDTTTASTTSLDNTTNDFIQSRTRTGNYRNILPRS